MTDHLDTARWLIERAKTINGDLAQSAVDLQAASAYMPPARFVETRANLDKAGELAIYLADGAAAIFELYGRLDTALERLSEVIYLEQLLTSARLAGVDLIGRVTDLLLEANG